MVLNDCSMRMIAASTVSSSRSVGDLETGILTLRTIVVFFMRTPEARTSGLRAAPCSISRRRWKDSHSVFFCSSVRPSARFFRSRRDVAYSLIRFSMYDDDK